MNIHVHTIYKTYLVHELCTHICFRSAHLIHEDIYTRGNYECAQKISDMATFNLSTPVEVFLHIYDILEFAALQDPKVVDGLNPKNSDHGWMTI